MQSKDSTVSPCFFGGRQSKVQQLIIDVDRNRTVPKP